MSNPTAGEPLISVITPVYDTDPEVLAECLDSVARQTHVRWEHCLVDDASPRPHIWAQLQAAAGADPRVRVGRREQNGGIVSTSNDALSMATGDVVAFLDHDDLLHPHALGRVAEAFADDEVDDVYTDEDVLEPGGRRANPFFKPDWSPERFRAQMYTCHLSAVRRSLVDDVGRFHEGFEGSQDWDLMLRITERARRIVHIPEVLYHWRIVPTSVLSGDHVKPWAYDAGARAIAAHLDRVGIDGEVEELPQRGHFRVRRRVQGEPQVSVIIPTKGVDGFVWGSRRVMVVEAVRSILDRSTYQAVELVVVADTSTPNGVLTDLAEIGGERLSVVEFDRPFNFSEKCNLGAATARGEILLFLNDDTEVIDPDWLETMVGLAQDPSIGAVGAQLLFEDGRIQHAGHVYLDGNPGHLMFGRMPDDYANRNALLLEREVSGVTGAALMCRAEVFGAVGGFSPEFPSNYNDVDLCQKVRSLGLRVVVTPFARLYHFESVSRDPRVTSGELDRLQSRWSANLRRDPFYSPNHTPGMDCFPSPAVYP